MYAYPDGHLATKNWVMVKKDGYQMSYEVDQGDWYWFNSKGSAIRANQRKIGNAFFLFNPSGKMYQSQWVGTYGDDYYRIDDGYSYEDGAKNEYYSHFGNMVKNQYLYLDDEAKGPKGWYWFDNDGKGYSLNDLEAEIVTHSNAAQIIAGVEEAKKDDVLAITPREDNVQTTVGEKVTLYYEVERASASDASPLTKHHDIYVVRGFEENENPGLLANNSNANNVRREANGVVSVDFEAKAPGKVDVVLIIDECEATITVEIVMGSDVAASTEVVVDGLFKTSGTGMEASGVKALKEITTDPDYEDSKDAVMDKWKSNKSEVSTLEETYLTTEGMMTDEPAVSEEAAEKLQGSLTNARSITNGVSVVGAALAVDPDTNMVQLNVDLPEEEESINEEFKEEYEKVTSLDITLLADGEEQSVLPLPILVDVSIPTEFDPEKTEVYHIHEGEEPIKLDITVNNGVASFAVDKLSTFVFVETGTGNNAGEGESEEVEDNTSNDNNYSDWNDYYDNAVYESVSVKEDKADNAESGDWKQDATGWWFRYSDGSYPVSKWIELNWNGTNNWYYFGDTGYMKTGWLLDGGLWYYLHSVSDGTLGQMYTGWRQIDGKWYYFNPVSGGPLGSLLVNTTTPDGYSVDENGVWIQ
ncbi:MAG: hypothetical protein IJ374_09735 [Lachnospiraceae bacterium]|nr:hypothetical protein [Lachnospiraceae bacterium]